MYNHDGAAGAVIVSEKMANLRHAADKYAESRS